MAKTKKAPSAVATIDNRKGRDRRVSERRKEMTAVAKERRVGERRAKVNRRRQIDPTTCERDYTDAEIEFMHALDQYKRDSGRMFPTCSEVLEVLIGLGYEKKSGGAVQPDRQALRPGVLAPRIRAQPARYLRLRPPAVETAGGLLFFLACETGLAAWGGDQYFPPRVSTLRPRSPRRTAIPFRGPADSRD